MSKFKCKLKPPKNCVKEGQSSCMNARGISPAPHNHPVPVLAGKGGGRGRDGGVGRRRVPLSCLAGGRVCPEGRGGDGRGYLVPVGGGREGRESIPILARGRGGEGGGGVPVLVWDTTLPPVDRHTPVKTVLSRRTTYAGGKKNLS